MMAPVRFRPSGVARYPILLATKQTTKVAFEWDFDISIEQSATAVKRRLVMRCRQRSARTIRRDGVFVTTKLIPHVTLRPTPNLHLRRGLRRLCPAGDQGKLFGGYLAVRPICGRHGHSA